MRRSPGAPEAPLPTAKVRAPCTLGPNKGYCVGIILHATCNKTRHIAFICNVSVLMVLIKYRAFFIVLLKRLKLLKEKTLPINTI